MHKKKSLGQHFLHERVYLELIVTTAAIEEGKHILEIGPGDGALTKYLLEGKAQVTAVEKDSRLIPTLTEKFGSKNITVIEGDILQVDISQIISDTNFKVVGNIPYYITGAILKKILSNARQPTKAVFLIQKEVAERIARSKKESILSLSVKAYGRPLYIQTVPSGAFSPPPSVDSAILEISDISRNNFKNTAHEDRFFALVRAGFAQKRKFLMRNLEPLLGKDTSDLLVRAGIEKKARAEDVSLPKWLILSEISN